MMLRTVSLSLFLLVGSASVSAQTSVIQTVFGDDNNEEFGMAVASIGDADGDGIPDYVVGSPEDSTTASRAGRAVLFSGADGSQLFDFTSAASNGNFGRSVAPAGDVDGDGRADVVVGRPWQILGGQGRVFTYSGADGSLLREWIGVAGDAFGHALANVGDLNADGIDEIAVALPFEGSIDEGGVQVRDGATGSVLQSFSGALFADQFGSAIGSGGDVNGDGFHDLIIGSQLLGDHGGVRVFSALTGALIWSLDGVPGDSGFGWRVAIVGDLNDDGRSEFAFSDTNGFGNVRVHSGMTGALLYTLSGGAGGDAFGWSLAAVGDVDQDTVPDLAVGSPGDDDLGSASGSLKVFSGVDGTQLEEWYGIGFGRAQGRSIDGAGDLNGDGIPDILVGATMDRASSGALGYVRVYSGRCLGSITPYGAGTPGSGGFVPLLSATGCPAPTTRLTISIEDGFGGAGGLLLVGAAPLSAPYAGGEVLVAPPWLSLPLFFSGFGDGEGDVHLPTVLPDLQIFPISIYLQAFVFDPGGFNGVALSRGLEIEVR